MQSFLRRKLAICGITLGIFIFALDARAQGHWTKAALFPEPMEETHATTANGKLYARRKSVSPGIAPGIVYEYDPADDKWTKKKNMPLPAHHMAMAEYKGKIYVIGGLVRRTNPADGRQLIMPGSTIRQTIPGKDCRLCLVASVARRLPKKWRKNLCDRGSGVGAGIEGDGPVQFAAASLRRHQRGK